MYSSSRCSASSSTSRNNENQCISKIDIHDVSITSRLDDNIIEKRITCSKKQLDTICIVGIFRKDKFPKAVGGK